MTPKHRPFLTRLRARLRSDRGASSPFFIIGGALVFGLISAGVGGVMHNAMVTMQQQKVNTTLAAQVSEVAAKEAARGFPVVSEYAATGTVTVTVGGAKLDAVREVVVDADAKTATVTVRAGKFSHGTWLDPASCADIPTNCMSATDVATPSLAHTFPQVDGVTASDTSGNITDPTEPRWADVATGAGFTVAIDQHGSLWTWGASSTGALGSGSAKEKPAPTALDAGNTIFTDVVATNGTAYALDEDGIAWSWGDGAGGKLGNGSTASLNRPEAFAKSTRWQSLSAWHAHACGVTTGGQLKCWGDNTGSKWRAGATASLTPATVTVANNPATTVDESKTVFTAVAVGSSHQLALDDTGTVWSWGVNSTGQLGTGGGASTKPVRVTDRTSGAHPMSSVPIVTIATAGAVSFATDTFGRAWAWGSNADGTLGDGTTTNRAEPTRIGNGLLFTQVFPGARTSFGLDRDGRLHAWGSNKFAQLGTGAGSASLIPVLVHPEARFISAQITPTSQRENTVRVWALDSTHRLWAWGAGAKAAWGDAQEVYEDRSTAQQTKFLPGTGKKITALAAGRAHSVALDKDGELWTWGDDAAGQLGNGSSVAMNTPQKLEISDTAAGAVSISLSAERTIVLNGDGIAFGAGNGNEGRFGDGSSRSHSNPVRVGDPDRRYQQIESFGSAAFAIDREDGTVWQWGYNEGGVSSLRPERVGGLPDGTRFIDIAATVDSAIALDETGNVWAWGANYSGQLGNGSWDDSTVAALVDLPRRITAVGSGPASLLAIDDEGAIWVAGKAFASAGDGPVPGRIAVTGTRFTAVAAGGAAGYALDTTGRLWELPAGMGSQPRLVSSVASVRFTDITAGDDTFAAIDTKQQAWAWGRNLHGTALGVSTSSATVAQPTRAFGSVKAVAVSSDYTGTGVIASDGSVWFAGANSSGRNGNGGDRAEQGHTKSGNWVDAFVRSANDDETVTFAQVYAERDSSYAIDTTGALWAWGANNASQLGVGTTAGAVQQPTRVLSTAKLTQMDATGSAVLAVDVAGSVHAWGAANATGVSTAQRSMPARVPVPAQLTSVYGGWSYANGIDRDGGLWGWGDNFEYIANPNTPDAGTLPPQRVPGVDGVSSVIIEDGQAWAITGDRKIIEWGLGLEGIRPWNGAGDATFSSLRGQGTVRAAVHEDGKLSVWGTDNPDVLGGAPPAGSNVATHDAPFVSGIAVGGEHILTLDPAGVVRSWGSDAAGQLGRDVEGAFNDRTLVFGGTGQDALAVQAIPDVQTSVWAVADVDAIAASGLAQVNVETDMPLDGVAVVCSDGSRKASAEAAHSSGSFQFANIGLDDLGGCDQPRLAVLLHGLPLATSTIVTVVVPVVRTADVTDGW